MVRRVRYTWDTQSTLERLSLQRIQTRTHTIRQTTTHNKHSTLWMFQWQTMQPNDKKYRDRPCGPAQDSQDWVIPHHLSSRRSATHTHTPNFHTLWHQAFMNTSVREVTPIEAFLSIATHTLTRWTTQRNHAIQKQHTHTHHLSNNKNNWWIEEQVLVPQHKWQSKARVLHNNTGLFVGDEMEPNHTSTTSPPRRDACRYDFWAEKWRKTAFKRQKQTQETFWWESELTMFRVEFWHQTTSNTSDNRYSGD
jgi:hypothetical protein